MSRRFVVAAVLAAGLLAIPGGGPGRAQNPGGDAPRKPVGVTPDPALLKIISVLHNQKVTFEGDLSQTPIVDILNYLAKRYDLTFVIAHHRRANTARSDVDAGRDTLHRFSPARTEIHLSR